MRSADVITAGVLILLGGVVVADALRLGIGWGTEGPQSGFFPFWLAVILVVVTGAVVIQALARGATRRFVTREQLRSVLRVLIPLAAFVVMTDPPGPPDGLGLYVAAAVYIAFYMRWVGHHTWVSVVLVAVLVPLVAFMVFEKWFLVPMPKGPVETWLGY
jgi:hypothetical protein